MKSYLTRETIGINHGGNSNVMGNYMLTLLLMLTTTGCSTISIARRIEDVSVNNVYKINSNNCKLEVTEIKVTQDILNMNFNEINIVCGREICDDEDRMFYPACVKFDDIKESDIFLRRASPSAP